MKTTRITGYDAALSVEENAAINNVSVAAIRSYIRSRGIDRAADRQLLLYNKVCSYAAEHPREKAPRIAAALGLAANTVRRYLKMPAAPQPKQKKTATLNEAQRIHFLSVSDSQTDILKAILAIHLPGRKQFQCDLTAWKLGFYINGLSRPEWCYDKYASLLNDERVADLAAFETDWHDGAFRNIVVDLPCSVVMPASRRRVDVATQFPTLAELLEEHSKMLRLAYRKLQTDGILVYKTMDFAFRGSPYWLSDQVLRMATATGFELADKFIYIDPKHNKIDRRRTRYTAAVPAHAYFFVFRKTTDKGEIRVRQESGCGDWPAGQ